MPELCLDSVQYLLCCHDADNPTISFLYNEASLPAHSNLAQDYATDVARSSNGIASYSLDVI